MIEEFTKSYFDDFKKCIDGISLEKIKNIVEIIYQAYKNNKQIFIMGNGGSASTASHFTCDLGKGTIVKNKPRFRVMSLNDNMSLLTALSNDFGYEQVFKEQLINLVNKDDVVISITCSGNSQNILNAVEYVHSKGAINIGFIGFDGGKLKNMVDESIIIPSKNYGKVESIHLILEHMISEYVKQKIEKG